MNLIELQRYTLSEEKSEEYLQVQGILQRFDDCPYCKSNRIGRVRRGKYKCYGCRKEWGPRRGSIFEGLRVPLVRVLIAIKLFELDTSVREAALGAIFSLLLCIVPLFAHNYTGAGLLFVFGIIYGVLADWIASWVIQKETGIPAR